MNLKSIFKDEAKLKKEYFKYFQQNRSKNIIKDGYHLKLKTINIQYSEQ